jgi:hypothetical protein
MDDLVEWLRAQLDADASPIAVPAWHEPWCLEPSVDEDDGDCLYCGATEDPANVTYQERSPQELREVDAKRDLLRLAERAHDYHETFTSGFASALERTLRMFALAYADRPGYKAEEWAP